MKKNPFKVVFAMYMFNIALSTNAQSIKQEEPVFGTVISKKTTSDSSKKPFNLLKPAFFRIGIIGGSMISLDAERESNGGMLGLRLEYGLSNHFSVIGQFQNNRSRNNILPDAQASLGLNWMPFKSRRLQPYVGFGVGIGGNSFGRNAYRFSRGRYSALPPKDLDNNNERRHPEGFGLVKLGLNYVLAKRLIATLESNYQLPFQAKNTNGNVNIALGLSYQFGRKKK